MNQRRFSRNEFFYKKFACSTSAKIRSRCNFVLNIGFGRSPTSVFEVGFVKSDSKTCELVPTCPACCECKLENFLSRKITVRFKLNLKTDGLNCKMFFKFGKRIERIHSACKQCRRIYICHFCSAKILVGNAQTLELHLVDAGCFKQIKMENCFTSCGIPHTATLPAPT